MIERYCTEEMSKIWSELNVFKNWLRVEMAVLEAMVSLGQLSKKDYIAIKEKAVVTEQVVRRIKEIDKEIHHDLLAFIQAIQEQLPQDVQKYYSMCPNYPNVHFISISNVQREPLPNLNYTGTIYHGVDTSKGFRFAPAGGEDIMWSGRLVEEKGPHIALEVIQKLQRPGRLVGIIRPDHKEWYEENVLKKIKKLQSNSPTELFLNLKRTDMPLHFQSSKVFLLPINWEEPFGLVIAESLASGTPVVAYAAGSTPELIQDGVTGYLVNRSETNKRGDYLIKKTGIEGLCEAVDKIYSLPNSDYLMMRKACRKDATSRFDIIRMANEYIKLYKELTSVS